MTNINLTTLPQLTTERLNLRQITSEDSTEIFELLTNKEVNNYYARARGTSMEDAYNYIQSITNAIAQNKLFYWGICFKNESKIIGTVCLWNFRKEECKAEIGYELLPDFQGKGVMKEVLPKVIEFGFQVLQFKKIDAWPNEDNHRSIKLLEKNNFKRDIDAENKIDWSKEAAFYSDNEYAKKVKTIIYTLDMDNNPKKEFSQEDAGIVESNSPV